MIIKLCMELVLAVLRLLLSGIALVVPSADWQSVQAVMSDVYGYLEQGAGVVAAYTHFSYLCTLLSLVVLVKTFLAGYHLIMWILRKIPYWGVRE